MQPLFYDPAHADDLHESTLRRRTAGLVSPGRRDDQRRHVGRAHDAAHAAGVAAWYRS